MPSELWVVGFTAALFVFAVGFAIFITKFYRKVDQGRALIVNKIRDVQVYFTGAVVIPILYRVEEMDISVKTVEINRRGSEGLICADNIRADIQVTFYVRVNKTREDVLKVAQAIGVKRASDQRTLEMLFIPKFAEALKTVGKKLDFEALYTHRDDFRDQIMEVIGRDLNGYVLDDAAIDYLEQTPLETLDTDNILDAQGIRKITDITTKERIKTNSFQNDERKRIKQQDVDADAAVFELDRQREEALAKQQREIASVQAREQAETEKIRNEERLRAETARITADQDLGVQDQNKQREIEVAGKNRERVVLVETERVEKDRALEAVIREREVELSRIAKEKALEVERKAIQDVIRERVAVERTVAEEEERIKEVRVVEEARRTKAQLVISAEAEAEERLVKDIKAAEAAEKAAVHLAREKIVLAEAGLEAADKDASAKIRLAEGVQAETAAEGLARVRVKEADAVATEKHGTAEAVVVREKGAAEAGALNAKMLAEAGGLTEKAKAIAALDEASRGHEEYRLRLDKDKAVELAAIDTQRRIAEAQAGVLAEGLKSANIDIVGGESVFIDRIVGAMASGKSLDGYVSKSETLQQVADEYLSGERSLPADLRRVLEGLSSGDVQNLTVSAVLAGLMSRADEAGRGRLQALIDKAHELGVDDLKLS
jgi:uncharacterized membrane protein YqiK